MEASVIMLESSLFKAKTNWIQYKPIGKKVSEKLKKGIGKCLLYQLRKLVIVDLATLNLQI